MNIKKTVVFIALALLLTSCFEDDVRPDKSTTSAPIDVTLNADDPNFLYSDDGFPLNENDEMDQLNLINKTNCFGDINCTNAQINQLADDFEFKAGKLILRGGLFNYNPQNNSWAINSDIQVTTFAIDDKKLTSTQESDFHQYTSELKNFNHLIDGVNVNLGSPLQPIIVTQGKLGLPELSSKDPGLCDVFAAERFEKLSSPPWQKYNPQSAPSTSNLIWPKGTGFDENTDTFAGETLIVCGEINLLNRTVKLEAKNIVFYNAHIKVMSDRDMPSGLRVNAEHIGYFGSNVIESNIINRASGHKNSAAPTIDLGASNPIEWISSNVPANNRLDSHFFKIFMAEHD